MSSPFDEARYRGLLEGLEVKEVDSVMPMQSELLRLEAEYYTSKTKEYSKFRLGEEIIQSVQYGTSEELNEESLGYPTLRLNEFELIFTSKPAKYCNKISKETFDTLKLKKGDVLVCRTNGNPNLVGKAAIVFEDEPYAFASYLFRLKPKREHINSETLVLFLNSTYGRLEINKHSMTSNQVNFSPAKFRQINIPVFSTLFQEKLADAVSKTFDLLKKSQTAYATAETLLLQSLGLTDFDFDAGERVNSNVKTFSASFLESGRLDAEYYQQKYERLESVCVKNARYTKRVSQIEIFNARGLQPDYIEHGEIDVINSRHILEKHLDYKNFEKTSAENWTAQSKARVLENDILIYTTGANIGRTQVYLSSKKALASNHVNILRIKNENPVYVAFVLNSKIGRLQTEQLSAGSAQQELYPKDIERFFIPFVSEPEQKKIAAFIKDSFALQTQSETLLTLAKRAVEIAIEQGESAAMAHLETQLQNDTTG